MAGREPPTSLVGRLVWLHCPTRLGVPFVRLSSISSLVDSLWGDVQKGNCKEPCAALQDPIHMYEIRLYEDDSCLSAISCEVPISSFPAQLEGQHAVDVMLPCLKSEGSVCAIHRKRGLASQKSLNMCKQNTRAMAINAKRYLETATGLHVRPLFRWPFPLEPGPMLLRCLPCNLESGGSIEML